MSSININKEDLGKILYNFAMNEFDWFYEEPIEVINEVEMAYRLLPKSVSIIGITGTNGKTTTTTLTYEIMKKAYSDRVHLAGNIGYPLSSILESVKENDIIVIECSCQQGENFETVIY